MALSYDVFPEYTTPLCEITPLPSLEAKYIPLGVTPFLIRLRQDHIEFTPLKLEAKYRKHFLDTMKHVILSNGSCSTKPTFETLIKFISTPSLETKSVDQRCGYRWSHFFLTKRGFTFGLRTVAPNEIHILQIGPTPLKLYISHQTAKAESSLSLHEEQDYSLQTLTPNTNYHIPPKTSYFILCYNRTYFALYRVEENLLSSSGSAQLNQTPPPVIIPPPVQTPLSVPMQTLPSVPIQTPLSVPMRTPLSVPMQTPLSVPMQTPLSVPMQTLPSVPIQTFPSPRRSVDVSCQTEKAPCPSPRRSVDVSCQTEKAPCQCTCCCKTTESEQEPMQEETVTPFQDYAFLWSPPTPITLFRRETFHAQSMESTTPLDLKLTKKYF